VRRICVQFTKMVGRICKLRVWNVQYYGTEFLQPKQYLLLSAQLAGR